MGFFSPFKHGISLIALAITAAFTAAGVPPSEINMPPLDLGVGFMPVGSSRGRGYRDGGSRRHNQWKKARASGRHDFRKAL